MKIKSDFVTNSSSTSFIIHSKVDAAGKEDFIVKYNSVMEEYINKRKWDEEFQSPPFLTSSMVTQLGPDEFIIQDFVAIFSSEKDIPQYIKDFSAPDSDLYKALKEAGIQLMEVEMKNFNE